MSSEADPRVLVVDDDPALAEVVARYLRREGFEVDYAADGATGLERALSTLPDLVVLDLMMPGMDGLRGLPAPAPRHRHPRGHADRARRGGRPHHRPRPRRRRLRDQALLAAGARGPGQAVLRRATAAAAPAEVRTGGGIEIDTLAHLVRRAGEPVTLTTKEYDLLVRFLTHPGRAFRREELLESVWGWSIGDTSTVTVHVRRLREKVEDDASAPRHLTTVRGVGYRWEP